MRLRELRIGGQLGLIAAVAAVGLAALGAIYLYGLGGLRDVREREVAIQRMQGQLDRAERALLLAQRYERDHTLSGSAEPLRQQAIQIQRLKQSLRGIGAQSDDRDLDRLLEPTGESLEAYASGFRELAVGLARIGSEDADAIVPRLGAAATALRASVDGTLDRGLIRKADEFLDHVRVTGCPIPEHSLAYFSPSYEALAGAIEAFWLGFEAKREIKADIDQVRERFGAVVRACTDLDEQVKEVDLRFAAVEADLQRLGDFVAEASAQGRARLVALQRGTNTTMLGAGIVVSLLVIGLSLALGQRIAWRISDMTRAMLQLAGGNLATVIPEVGRRDEIGEMADAVQTFKDNARALRENEQRLRAIYDQAAVGICLVAPDGRFLQSNQRFCDMLGYDRAELEGLTFQEITHPEDLPESFAQIERALAGEEKSYTRQKRYTRKDGSVMWASLSVSLVRNEDGSLKSFISVIEDVSDRKRAEESARLAQSRLTNAIENIDAGFALYDADDRLVMCNTALKAMSGVPDLMEPGVTFDTHLRGIFKRGLVPEVADREDEWLAKRMAQHSHPTGPFEVQRGGRSLEVRPHRLPDGGSMYLVVDIAERKAAEEGLRQAQKMEAIGSLTGGVAHDFNNLLGIILGNLDLLHEALEPDDRRRRLVDPAISAAERGAALTERLLAFSRKQALQPQVVDINALLGGTIDLLQRSLGETVEVRTVMAGELWPCEVDPNQMENAVLNLAVNARDAMPDGGTLTIETGNVQLDKGYTDAHPEIEPGDYVLVTVSDDGTGMTPAVLARVFEPFFTTKPVGKGTGLGLSMIYGFVKQSDGDVTVQSEPGEGTTIRIYLPRVERSVEASHELDRKAPAPRGQGERILIVEDDGDLLALGVKLLTGLGYQVLQAADGASALRLAEASDKIDLLLTDVVLPGGMNGKQLADKAVALNPSIRVLYMSGYSENAIAHHGRLDAGVHLVEKPFRKLQLAQKVRHVLANGKV